MHKAYHIGTPKSGSGQRALNAPMALYTAQSCERARQPCR
jgi:hypothetical protein